LNSAYLDVDGKLGWGNGDFEDDTNVYMRVPEGFEKWYDPNKYVLYLQQTLYGLKQAAKVFWKKLLMAFGSMGFHCSKANPCLYYKWDDKHGLILWVSWINNC